MKLSYSVHYSKSDCIFFPILNMTLKAKNFESQVTTFELELVQ